MQRVRIRSSAPTPRLRPCLRRSQAAGRWPGCLARRPRRGPEIRAQVAEIEDSFVGVLRAELERALRLGRVATLDPELTARAWVAMAQGLIAAWASGRVSASPERIHAELRRLTLRSAGIEITMDMKLSTKETT